MSQFLKFSTPQLELEYFLLTFKKISSYYEFVAFLFRLWLWIPTNFVALFLTNHKRAYLYLSSNISYEKNDQLDNQGTINFNPMYKIMRILCYGFYISRKVIFLDFLIENFLPNWRERDFWFAKIYNKWYNLRWSHLEVRSQHNILSSIYESIKVL